MLGRFALSMSIVAVAAPAFAASTTLIPAGDAFLLGGEQRSVVRVVGRNTGPVPVELLTEGAGRRTSLGVVPSGAGFDREIGPGLIAVVRNASATREARVSIELSPAVSTLSMRYQLPRKD